MKAVLHMTTFENVCTYLLGALAGGIVYCLQNATNFLSIQISIVSLLDFWQNYGKPVLVAFFCGFAGVGGKYAMNFIVTKVKKFKNKNKKP